MRRCTIVAAALLLALAGCGPRPSVEIRVTATPAPEVSRSVSDSDRETAFVLNPATQRFHLPGCTWAQRMDPERRIEYDGDRETLIAVGYQSCHYCDP